MESNIFSIKKTQQNNNTTKLIKLESKSHTWSLSQVNVRLRKTLTCRTGSSLCFRLFPNEDIILLEWPSSQAKLLARAASPKKHKERLDWPVPDLLWYPNLYASGTECWTLSWSIWVPHSPLQKLLDTWDALVKNSQLGWDCKDDPWKCQENQGLKRFLHLIVLQSESATEICYYNSETGLSPSIAKLCPGEDISKELYKLGSIWIQKHRQYLTSCPAWPLIPLNGLGLLYLLIHVWFCVPCATSCGLWSLCFICKFLLVSSLAMSLVCSEAYLAFPNSRSPQQRAPQWICAMDTPTQKDMSFPNAWVHASIQQKIHVIWKE